MARNIVYQTDAIDAFYSGHRRRWADFYPSERTVFEAIAADGASFARVLDVGCAVGGLGEALIERFKDVTSYTGIDINRQAIETAARIADGSSVQKRFIAADICDAPQIAGETFDVVTALGVADWNLDPSGIVNDCWKHVRPGGYLVMSLRLTPHATICDMNRSYQFIWFNSEAPPPDAERAPYNVFNSNAAIDWMSNLSPRPASLFCYGYWGKPSSAARVPYDRLVFSVLALQRPVNPGGAMKKDIRLPDDAGVS